VTSDGLEVTLTQLQRFSNYSLQVLAYTRKGEGVRSNAIYVRTLEDGKLQLKGSMSSKFKAVVTSYGQARSKLYHS